MGRDGLQVVIQIRKFVIITTRICYRSVWNHPFLVGILLFLLFLYRSSPFLFSVLVSFSPVLVCTAVLLGTLLSFGESTFPLSKEDERSSAEMAELKTGSVENNIHVEQDERIDRDSGCTELRREIVEGTIDKQPSRHSIDRVHKFETDGDFARSSMPTDQISGGIQFGKQLIYEEKFEFEKLEREQKLSLDGQNTQVGVDVGISHNEVLENQLLGKSQAENFEDYKSAEGSFDTQARDQLDSSTGSWERSDDALEDSLTPVQKVYARSSHDEGLENSVSGKVQAQNCVDYKLAEGSIDVQMRDQFCYSASSWEQSDDVLEDRLSPVQKVQAAVLSQLRNQLESSLGSWNRLDVVVENRSSAAQKAQAENSEDYKSAEGSVDAQITDQLESSFRLWNQLGSDHDDDDESDSGSDGAESSSPDASMADIIPMLDELHPLLEDENPQTSNLSRQSSAVTMARSGKSHGSSIHSGDESDQKGEEVADIKSDADDDDDEEDTQGSKEDKEKSPITWTEDDQKNLMDLGSSELERNQRLESLIARRRARRMMAERNLIDLDGMDLQFQVAPISTTRCNPFDLPNYSYDDLGLPPIPGSAPSVLQPRRNPFDLPYDSSEEKPDLMADSFQQEFMELYQGETSNQREAVFRRNETFSIGSSIFNFGRYEGRDATRASRFRPYFVPERTDSDVMSYSSSLHRQSSELGGSKASSAAETESISRDGYEEEKMPGENESALEMEPSSDIDQTSLLVELGSQSSDDLHSFSDKEKDFVLHVPEIELGGAGNSPAAVSNTVERQLLAEITIDDRGNDPEAESWMTDREISAGRMGESMQDKHSTSSSSSSTPEDYSDVKGNVNEDLVSREESQVDYIENVNMLVNSPLGTTVSDIQSEHSLETSDFNPGTEVIDDHPKEPVYDSNPQAVRKSHSFSSISSDLHLGRSEIHLCQAPSIRRDLLMTEEPKVHDGNAERSVSDGKQGVDDHGLTKKLNKEGDGHDMRDQFQFSGVPINSEASVTSEYELHLCMDSSDIGLVKDKLSEHEGREVLNQEDDVGVYMEGKLETIEDKDDNASAVHEESPKDLTLTQDRRDTSILDSDSLVQSEFSSLAVELREEAIVEEKADQQFLASSSNLMYQDNDVIEEVLSALDESHHLPDDSSIDDPSNKPEEQESSVVHGEVEDDSQVNNVDEILNIIPAEEPRENNLPDLLHSDQPSFQPEEFESKPVAELADMEHVDSDISQELGVSGGDTDIKDLDEEFLSELDAVGDFIVKDIGPNLDISMTNSNAGLDSNVHEQVLGESHTNTGSSFIHDTSFGANTGLQSFELMTATAEVNGAGFQESNLDSHAGDANDGLLVLEAQSVEDIDAAFKRLSEGDVQEPIIAGSIEAELMRELVEASHPETEFVLGDIEPGTHATELVSPEDTAAVDNSDPVERIAPDLASVEGHNLDFNVTDSGLSVMGTEVSELDDEDWEKIVETETAMFDVGEASQEPPEADMRVVSTEAAPLQINEDIKEMPEFSVVEASITPAFVSSAQVETLGFRQSESQQTDDEIKEIQESAVAEASIVPPAVSEDQMDRVNSVESRSLLIERIGSVESPVEASSVTSIDKEDEIKRVDSAKSPVVEASIISFVDSEDQVGGLGSVEFPGSSPIVEDISEIQEPLAHGESIAPAIDSEDQLEKVGSVESESLPMDKDIVESTVEEIISSAGSEDQNERFGSVESEPLPIDRELKEIQVLHHDEKSNASRLEFKDEADRDAVMILESMTIVPSAESEYQKERFGSVEPELLLIDGEVKEIQESHVDETSNASLLESKVEADRDAVMIQESPSVEANIAPSVVEPRIVSSVESEHQVEAAPHVEVVKVQALQNSQFASQQQSDDLVSDVDDAASTVIQSTGMEFGSEGSHNTTAEKLSLHGDEGESHESHLKLSSSSSSSSSSTSSDSGEC